MTIPTGPVAQGGPKFLVVFGSALLIIWGAIAATVSGAENTLVAGTTGDGLRWVAVVFWVIAITCMYMAFSRSLHGQRACLIGAIVSLFVGFAFGAGWLFWWLFSGGLVGLAAVLSDRAARHGGGT